ncbi:MAG TPA: nitroreductase family protein [Candidatus Dormibacteraeota bacterium]|nr:nitroreductase family protein [Candidatus Dormibacteraeota bacterium]
MANPVFDAARTVLAVREYADRPIPDDALDRIVEAAHLTASAGNQQPWHFVVVRDRATLGRLAGLVRSAPYVGGAAAAIVVAGRRESAFAVSDVSRAIQTMVLTAWGEGIGSNWTGSPGMEGVRDAVGIPAAYDVVAVVPLGYPLRDIGRGLKRRRPLAEVASAEQFGTPYRPGAS